jgi:hypothetical protein
MASAADVVEILSDSDDEVEEVAGVRQTRRSTLRQQQRHLCLGEDRHGSGTRSREEEPEERSGGGARLRRRTITNKACLVKQENVIVHRNRMVPGEGEARAKGRGAQDAFERVP